VGVGHSGARVDGMRRFGHTCTVEYVIKCDVCDREDREQKWSFFTGTPTPQPSLPRGWYVDGDIGIVCDLHTVKKQILVDGEDRNAPRDKDLER
jgi:hypothetical protein